MARGNNAVMKRHEHQIPAVSLRGKGHRTFKQISAHERRNLATKCRGCQDWFIQHTHNLLVNAQEVSIGTANFKRHCVTFRARRRLYDGIWSKMVRTPTVLEVFNLSKSFGAVPVFRDITFSMDAGEAVALTGESGSGKSTLLHLLAGLDTADEGEIRVANTRLGGQSDADLAAYRRTQIGVVFQQFNLVPSLNIRANLAFQARLANRLDTKWVETLAERLGLADLLSRYPEELSGGQQQRVAIGRAIASRPGLILADEPTGNLDEMTGDEVMAILRELVSETGAALLMVTHSERLAASLDRRLHLRRGALA